MPWGAIWKPQSAIEIINIYMSRSNLSKTYTIVCGFALLHWNFFCELSCGRFILVKNLCRVDFKFNPIVVALGRSIHDWLPKLVSVFLYVNIPIFTLSFTLQSLGINCILQACNIIWSAQCSKMGLWYIFSLSKATLRLFGSL